MAPSPPQIPESNPAVGEHINEHDPYMKEWIAVQKGCLPEQVSACIWETRQCTPSPWKEVNEALLDKLAELADAAAGEGKTEGRDALTALKALNANSANATVRW